MVSGNCSIRKDAVGKVINSVGECGYFAELLKAQSPYILLRRRIRDSWFYGTTLSTLMCSLMGLQDPFKRREDERRNETHVEEVEFKELPTSCLSLWLYPVFLSYSFTLPFIPEFKGCVPQSPRMNLEAPLMPRILVDKASYQF
jgi:hypothetical protein